MLRDYISLSKDGRTFLNQSLDLFASYLFGQTVELGAFAVGKSAEHELDETGYFLRELEARHAIACCIRFKEIINRIERSVSSVSVLTNSESKGAIKGRLNIPKYLSRRIKQRSFPRTYPIIINEELPNTPENALVCYALRGLTLQLSRSPFHRSYAEGRLSAQLYGWMKSHLNRLPWAEVNRAASLQRLQRETLQRIRKRQTGNDFAYESLVEWVHEWQVDVSKLGDSQKSQIIDGLLAFPSGDFFWEKVFEVWCLQEVAKALEALGCKRLYEPQPLYKRTSLPIYVFNYKGKLLEIWFQKQLPIEKASWRYTNGNSLRGIPDISISTKTFSPLLLDAKFRKVKTDTRSEEVYKLLGYAENFNGVFDGNAFHGILIFFGDETAENKLVGPNNGQISLLVANSENLVEFSPLLRNQLQNWLDRL